MAIKLKTYRREKFVCQWVCFCLFVCLEFLIKKLGPWKGGCRNQRPDCAGSLFVVIIQPGSQKAAVERKSSKFCLKIRLKSWLSTLLTLCCLHSPLWSWDSKLYAMTSGFWDSYRKHPSDLLMRGGMFFHGFCFSRRTPRTSRSSGINETPKTMSQKWTIFPYFVERRTKLSTFAHLLDYWGLSFLEGQRFFFSSLSHHLRKWCAIYLGKKYSYNFPIKRLLGSWDAKTSRECQHWSLKAGLSTV